MKGSKGKKKEKREEGEGEKKKEVPSGEVIKEGASWLAWQQFKGGGSPCLPCTQMAVAGTTAKHTMPCGKTVSFIDRRVGQGKEGGRREHKMLLFALFFEVEKKKT